MSEAPLPAARRREGGFTLLEIMIALAILAVGAVCVMSTFAAALALHMRRETDVRTARVMEEARQEAQAAWEGWSPTKERPLPPDIRDAAYSRDVSLTYSVVFQPVSGQPAGPQGVVPAGKAVVRVLREGQDPSRARTMEFLLVRTGFASTDRKTSVSWDLEKKKNEQMKKNDPSSTGPR